MHDTVHGRCGLSWGEDAGRLALLIATAALGLGPRSQTAYAYQGQDAALFGRRMCVGVSVSVSVSVPFSASGSPFVRSLVVVAYVAHSCSPKATCRAGGESFSRPAYAEWLSSSALCDSKNDEPRAGRGFP